MCTVTFSQGFRRFERQSAVLQLDLGNEIENTSRKIERNKYIIHLRRVKWVKARENRLIDLSTWL